MKNKRVGEQTIKFETPPKIIATYSIVGPKEGEGHLKDYFDEIVEDDLMGKYKLSLCRRFIKSNYIFRFCSKKA